MNYFWIYDLLIAYMLDLLIGDPYWLPHPVRFIGYLIKKIERALRIITDKLFSTKPIVELFAGGILAFLVIFSSFFLVFIILLLASKLNTLLFHVVNIYFIYTSFATRCLGDEATKVQKALGNEDLEVPRKQIAMLVGRNTENLDRHGIIKATVETTSENTVDGVISPMFYAFLGGFLGLSAPIVYAFKAVSTLDSMVGYKNKSYLYFGRVSAKIDDFLNLIPARITGVLIPLVAFIIGKNSINSMKIMLRDRKNHKSPNCAYPEAATAGALGIRLGGPAVYFGETVEKDYIGDSLREPEASDIRATVQMMYLCSFVFLIFCIVLVYFLGGFAK